MRCSEFLKSYTDHRDGLIQDPTRRVQIQQHLDDCRTCNRYDRALRFGIEALRAQEINPSERSRVRLRVRLALANRRPRTSRSVPVAAAAAMIGIAVVWGAFGTPRISATQPVVTAGPRPPLAFVQPIVPKRLAATTIPAGALASLPPAPLEYEAYYEPVSYRFAAMTTPDP